jgi:Na+/H+ antiporter NhaD/arsenite permease-like protein
MHFGLFFILMLGISTYALDRLMVRKQDPPTERQRMILLEIMDANLLIENRNKFLRFSVYFIVILTCLVLFSPSFLIIILGILLILIIEKDSLNQYLTKVDWRFLFFLIGIFLMIGNLYAIGILQPFLDFIIQFLNTQILLSAIIVLIISALLSSFSSRVLTIVLFYTAFQELFTSTFITPYEQTLLIMSLCLGAVIGGHMIPQSSSHILKTLDLINEERDQTIDYQLITYRVSSPLN